MSEAKRRRIKQLRALAASTTFPEEAKSARAKADKLEASLPKVEPSDYSIFDAEGYLRAMPNFAAMNVLNEEILQQMMQQMMDQMRDL